MATEADIQVPILCETRGEQVGVFVDNIINTSMTKLSHEQLLLQLDEHPTTTTTTAVEGENFLKPPFTAAPNQETQIQLNDDGSDSTQKHGDKATVVISETKEEDKLNDDIDTRLCNDSITQNIALAKDSSANITGEVTDQCNTEDTSNTAAEEVCQGIEASNKDDLPSKNEEEEETHVVKKISSITEDSGVDEHLEEKAKETSLVQVQDSQIEGDEQLPSTATHHVRGKNEDIIEAELSENEASTRCLSVEQGRQIETPLHDGLKESLENIPIDETISVAPELIEVTEEPAQTLRDGTDHTLLLTPKLDDQKLEFAATEPNAEESSSPEKDGNEECSPVSSVMTSEEKAGVSLDVVDGRVVAQPSEDTSVDQRETNSFCSENVVHAEEILEETNIPSQETESHTPCIGEVEEVNAQVKTTDHKSEDDHLGSEVSEEGVSDRNKTTSEQEVLENERSVEDNSSTSETITRESNSSLAEEQETAVEKAEETPLVQVQESQVECDEQLEEESEKLPSTDIVKDKDEDLIEAELSENDKDSLQAPPEEQSRDATQHGNTTEAEEATIDTVDGQKEGLESCPPIVSSSPKEGSMNAALQEVTSDHVDVPENLSIDEACTEINNVVPDITEVADEPHKKVGFVANEETSVDDVQLNAEESNSNGDVVPEQCSPVSSVVTSEVKAGGTVDDPDVDDTKVVTLIPCEETELHAPCIGEVEEADAQLKTTDNKSEDEKTTEQDMSCDLRSEVSKEGESEPDKTTSGEEELENERSVEDNPKDAAGEVSLEDSASNSDELSESKPSFSNEEETTVEKGDRSVTASDESPSESHGDEEFQSKSLEDDAKDLSIPNLAEKSVETSLIQVQDSQIQCDEHLEVESERLPLTEVSTDIVQDKVEDIKEAELCEDIEVSSLSQESVDATLHGSINEVEEATTDAVDGEQKENLESFPATASTSPGEEESLKAVVEETNEKIIDRNAQAEVVENLTIGEAHSVIKNVAPEVEVTEKPDETVRDDQPAEEEILQNAETSDALDNARVVTQLSKDTGSNDQNTSIMLEETNIPSEEPESQDPCTTEAEAEAEDEKPTEEEDFKPSNLTSELAKEGETDQSKAKSDSEQEVFESAEDNSNTAAEEVSQENSASSEATTTLDTSYFISSLSKEDDGSVKTSHEDYAFPCSNEIHGDVECQPKILEEDAAAEKPEESSQLERDEHLEVESERLPSTETSTNVSDEKEVEFSEDSAEALHVAPECIEESDSRQENKIKEEQSTEDDLHGNKVVAQEDSISEVDEQKGSLENVAVEENSEPQVDCSERENEEAFVKDNQDSSLTEAIVEETNSTEWESRKTEEANVDALQVKSEDVSVEEQILNTDPSETPSDNAEREAAGVSDTNEESLEAKCGLIDKEESIEALQVVAAKDIEAPLSGQDAETSRVAIADTDDANVLEVETPKDKDLTIGEDHSDIITEKPGETVRDDTDDTLLLTPDQPVEFAADEGEIRQNAEEVNATEKAVVPEECRTDSLVDADDAMVVTHGLSTDTGSNDENISLTKEILNETDIPTEENESRDQEACTAEGEELNVQVKTTQHQYEDEKPTEEDKSSDLSGELAKEGATSQQEVFESVADNSNTAADEVSQENSASPETTTTLDTSDSNADIISSLSKEDEIIAEKGEESVTTSQDYGAPCSSEIHGGVEGQPKTLEEDAAAEKLEESSQLERDEHLEVESERLPLTETSTNDNVSDEKEVEFSEDSAEALHVAPECIDESDSRQENKIKEEQSTEADEAQEDSISEVVDQQKRSLENVAVEENSETQVDCSEREGEEALVKDNQDSSLTEAIVEETNVEKHVDALQVKSEDVPVEEQLILNTDPSETPSDNAERESVDVSDKNEESLEAKDLTVGEAHAEIISEKPDETVRNDDTDDTLLLTPDQPVEFAADEEEIRQNAEEVNTTEKAVVPEKCHTDSLVDVDDTMVVTRELSTDTGSNDENISLTREGESDQNKDTSEHEVFESLEDNSNTAADEVSQENGASSETTTTPETSDSTADFISSLSKEDGITEHKGNVSVTTSQDHGDVESQPKTLEEDVAAEKFEESSLLEQDEHLEVESERLQLTETSTSDNVSVEKEVEFSEDSAEALHVAPECIEESDSRQEHEMKEEQSTEADEAQEDSISEVVDQQKGSLENVAVEENPETQVDCSEREDEEALVKDNQDSSLTEAIVEEQILNTDTSEISSDNAEKEAADVSDTNEESLDAKFIVSTKNSEDGLIEKEESIETLQVAAATDNEAPLSGQETETSCAGIADTDDANGLEDETPPKDDTDLTTGEDHFEIITERPDERVRDDTDDTLILTTPDQPVEFGADEEIRQNAEEVNTTQKVVVPEECHTDSLVDVDDENISVTKEILEETNIPTEETESRDQEACTTEGEELNVQVNKYEDEKPTEEDDKSSNLISESAKEGESDQNKATSEQEVFESVEDNSNTAAEEVSQENSASSETTTTLETSDFISSLSKEDEIIALKGEESVTTSQDNGAPCSSDQIHGDVECQPKTLEEGAAAEKFEESSQLKRDEHLEVETEKLPLTETSANDNVSYEREVEFSEDSAESQHVAPECIEESDLSQENKIKEEQSTEGSKVEAQEDSISEVADQQTVSLENVAVEENSETQVDCSEREDEEPLEKDIQDSSLTEAIVEETRSINWESKKNEEANVEKHFDSLQVKSEDVSVEEQILNTDPSETSTDNAERETVEVSDKNEECLDEAEFFVPTKNSEGGLIEKEESIETLQVATTRDIEAPFSGQETETSCVAIADTDDANGLGDETPKDKQTEDCSQLEQNEDLRTDSENTPAPTVSIIQTSLVNEEGVEKTVEEHIETAADPQQTCHETKEDETIVDAKDDVVANVPNEDHTPFELDGSQNPSSEETQAEKIDNDGPTAVHEANFANENTPKSNLSEEEEKERDSALEKEEVCIESLQAADADLKEATSSVQDSQIECDEHLEKKSEKLPSTDISMGNTYDNVPPATPNVKDKDEDLIEAESRQIETPAETSLVNTENDKESMQASPEEQSTGATQYGNTTEAEEATVDGQKEGLENLSIDESCTEINNVVPDITEVTEEPDQKVGIVANEEAPVEDIQLNAEESNNNEKDGNGDVLPEQCSPVSSVVTSEVKAGDTLDDVGVDDAKVVTQIPEDTSIDRHGTIDSYAENITNIPSEETESHTPCIREVEELEVQLETTESKSEDEKTTEQDISCDLRSEVSKEGESEPNKTTSEEEALENERSVEDNPKDAAGEVSQEDSASTETNATEASNSDELQSKSESNSSLSMEQETNVEKGDRSVTASEESLSESHRDEECQSKRLEDDVKDHTIPSPAEKSEETSLVQVQDSTGATNDNVPPGAEDKDEDVKEAELSENASIDEQKESFESSPPTASTSTEEGSIKEVVQEIPFVEDSPQQPPKGIIDEHEPTTIVDESIIKADDLIENREATLIDKDLSIELAAEDINEPCLNETNSEEEQIPSADPRDDNIENKAIDPMTETPKDEEKSSNLTAERTEDLDVNEGIIEHIPEVSNYKQQEASITEVSEEHTATSNEHVSDDTSLESEVSMKISDQVVEEANSCDDKTDSEKTEVSNDGSIAAPANETLAETDSRGSTEAEVQVPNGEDDAEFQDSNAVASQEVSTSNVEMEEETETKEPQKQEKEIQVSELIQDSSVENIERDAQSCLASPSDSGVTEEVQKLKEVPLPAQEENITETTDCKESDVVEGATNNEDIDHPEQNDTRESFPEDKRTTEEVLVERAANDILPESPSETSGVDHYATERELTNEEGLCAEKAATGDDEKEVCEETISDNISAAPDVIQARDTDVAKSTDKSDNIIDTTEGTMVNENTSVECIIVSERSATYLETENGDEAPDIKETNPSFVEGEDVENANYPGSLAEEKPNSDEVAFAPEVNKSGYESNNQVLESIVQADKTVPIDTLEQEEASYEKEILKDDISSKKEQLSKVEDEDTKAYYQGSCQEDVIRESHQEDEIKQEQQEITKETVEFIEDGSQTETISKVSEELEEKAVENQEEKILTNEAIDQILHQEEQAKIIEEPTPKIDTVEAQELAIASAKADIEDSTKEGVQIAVAPGKEIEEQNNEDEICSLDEVHAKDEENIMLSEGKIEEEAKETNTSTKPDEVEDKEVYIEGKKFDFVSQTEGTPSECKVSDGAQIPEDNEISTTKNYISEEDHPNKRTKDEVSSSSEDVAPTEQASEASIVTAEVQVGAAAPEATGIESQEVEEVNGQCAAMEESSASMVPPVSSTSKIIQDWTVEPPLETEDQHIEVHALPQELNIKDSEVKVAEKDDVVNLQSIGDIAEDVQVLSKESFEVSNNGNPVGGDAEENLEIKKPQEKKSAPDATVSETLDQETEKQLGSGAESGIHQSSVEDTAQHEKGEGCQQMDSPLSLPQAQLSGIKTSEKDLPVHVAAEVEVSPLLSKDKHVVLDTDGASNLIHENLGGDKNISTEYSQRELEIEKPSEIGKEEAECGNEEIIVQEREGTYESKETSQASLSDLFEVSMRERTQKADHPATEEEPENSDEAEHENLKTDEEKDVEEESHEQLKADLASEAPVIVDMGDADVKVAHKKSHNILSGVGSKVKHSIAKVKKAITGKSSHPKTPSPKKVTN